MRLMFMRLGVYLFRGLAFSDNSTNKQLNFLNNHAARRKKTQQINK